MQRLMFWCAQAAAARPAAFLIAACGSGDSTPGTVRFALTDCAGLRLRPGPTSLSSAFASTQCRRNENSLGWDDLQLSRRGASTC